MPAEGILKEFGFIAPCREVKTLEELRFPVKNVFNEEKIFKDIPLCVITLT